MAAGEVSRRAQQATDFCNLNAPGASICSLNAYHPSSNPNGTINVGVSENKLCHDLLAEQLKKKRMPDFSEELQYYFNFTGIASFKKAIAGFLTTFFRPQNPLIPENITVLNGTDVVLEAFAFSIADPGEGILVPAPFYSLISNNFGCRTNVTPVPVYTSTDNGDPNQFLPSRELLEDAYKKTVDKGIKIKGMLVVNPHNPTGLVYPKSTLQVCLDFASRHSLHICVDEVYGMSVFDDKVPFVSVLSMDVPDPQRTHVIWGFSKDFAMSGFRCGVFHSTNQAVNKSFHKLSYFHNIPVVAQRALENLLSDHEWIGEVFFPAKQFRLRKAHTYLTDGLKELGIPFIDGTSGFFVWVDLRELLNPPSSDNELKLWHLFLENGVFCNLGQAFCAREPGWFRIVYAHQENIISAVLSRLKHVIQRLREGVITVNSVLIEAEKQRDIPTSL